MARGGADGILRRDLTLAVAALLALPSSAAAAPLDEHRPQLRYDRDETHVVTAAVGPNRPVIYGREKTGGDGRRWLQYWLYYDYNAQDRGVLRTGRHEGDWEFAQIRLGQRGPDRVTLAQHRWAESCAWNEIERRGNVPVLYPANGSHATYARAGTMDRPFPDPNDEADGRGRRLRPEVEAFGAWVSRREPWGTSRAGWMPGEQSSPLGPPFQDDERWRDPSAYDEGARSCGSGPPGRPWQTAVLLGLLAAGAAALVARRARLRRSHPAT